MGGSTENRKSIVKFLFCIQLYNIIIVAPRPNSSPSILMVAIAIACLLMLLLPLEGEFPSWPAYLHITVNQKLVAAFTLGKCNRDYTILTSY
jgi:hypothetical protein